MLHVKSVEQRIPVPEVDAVSLVWSGRRAAGYRSALYIELVPSPISSATCAHFLISHSLFRIVPLPPLQYIDLCIKFYSVNRCFNSSY